MGIWDIHTDINKIICLNSFICAELNQEVKKTQG